MAALWQVAPALAQTPPPGRAAVQPPRRPSISPYLNLGIENSGALPPYQTFVQPRIEQQKQQASHYLLQAKTAALEKNEFADSHLRQTGLGGKFQNYSHFYQAQRPRVKP
jgi:hypothetical protein